MFEVGAGNTCNNTFQLVTQQYCVASCSNLLLVLQGLGIFPDKLKIAKIISNF